MRVEEVSGRDALNIVRAEWQALQADCPGATPFQTWEWNAAWWRHFGARKHARILLFRHDKQDAENAAQDTLVGIAPFYTSFHLGTPLRRLAWIGTGHSDYLGPLASSDRQDDVAHALREHLDTHLRGWDIADLQQMRPDAPLLMQAMAAGANSSITLKPDRNAGAGKSARRAKPALRPAHTPSVLPIEPCPFVTLPAQWEAFTARLGKKMRSNLGYYDRLLQKTFGVVSFDIARTDTLDAGMTALFDLHQKRWNARWLPGVLGSRRVQDFHRDIAQTFLDRGWLRLHLLTIDGAIRAVLYCFAYGGRTFYYLGGFAPDMGKYSLGTLLTGRAIRCAIEEDCTEFDFLRGDEPYKYKWLPDERMNHRLLLIRPRKRMGGLGELPGRAGFALNRVERYVAQRAKAFAEAQGGKPKARNPETPAEPAV